MSVFPLTNLVHALLGYVVACFLAFIRDNVLVVLPYALTVSGTESERPIDKGLITSEFSSVPFEEVHVR